MKTTLLLARHGNTFKAGDTILRIGRTDLPLVENILSIALGKYLKKADLIPDVIYASPLQRTLETARYVAQELAIDMEIISEPRLIELDYGIDEGKPEHEVLERIGQAGLAAWNEKAIVPNCWNVVPQEIISMWHDLVKDMEIKHGGKKILLVTSNGVLRFAPYTTGDFCAFTRKRNNLKVATGGLCILEKNKKDKCWTCIHWNLQPQAILL